MNKTVRGPPYIFPYHFQVTIFSNLPSMNKIRLNKAYVCSCKGVKGFFKASEISPETRIFDASIVKESNIEAVIDYLENGIPVCFVKNERRFSREYRIHLDKSEVLIYIRESHTLEGETSIIIKGNNGIFVYTCNEQGVSFKKAPERQMKIPSVTRTATIIPMQRERRIAVSI